MQLQKLELSQLRQGDAALGYVNVFRVAFDADEIPAEQRARDAGGTAPHEWIENGVARFREKLDAPLHDFQCLLRRVRDQCLLRVFKEASVAAIEDLGFRAA